jgi:hypothetical protein
VFSPTHLTSHCLVQLLKFFSCSHVEGRYYLLADMRVSCRSSEYRGYIPFVVVGILIYPVGITCEPL